MVVINMNNRIYIIVSILLTVFMMFSVNAVALAADDDIDTQVNQSVSALGGDGGDGSVEGELKKIADILVIVGFLVSAIKLVQIGLKLMMSPANKRSDAKASLAPWIVGVFVCALWLTLGEYIMKLIAGVGPDDVFDVGL